MAKRPCAAEISLWTIFVALGIFDAVLTVVLSKPTLYANRREVWPPVEATYSSSVDLTRQGLARQPTWVVGTVRDMNACLLGKVPVARCFNVLHNELYEALLEHGVLGAAALGKDRIWFAARASQESLDKKTLQRLAARADALGGPCLVVANPAAMSASTKRAHVEPPPNLVSSLEQLPRALQMSVQLCRYDGRHLDFDVTCPGDGWLLVTDRWAPGWRAWVNDRETPVWIGNLAFRALPVERGENRIRFLYCPFAYPWLVLGSWGTLVLVAAASVGAGVRQRGKTHCEQEAGAGVSQKPVCLVQNALPRRVRTLN